MASLKHLWIQLIPLTFVLALVGQYLLIRRWHNVRMPVKDKLLRPPGESLRVKMEELDEQSISWVFVIIVLPVIAVVTMSKLHWAVPAMFTAITSGVAALVLFQQIKKRSNYRLGFQGERAVAEELNQLMRKGCVVFHDLLMSDKANIDHVVVAPTGVFLIETKTRRKRRAGADREDHKLIYDGKTLHFPHGSDTHGLAQAERNASWLAQQLSKALAEPIRVTPILTFPGWFIERTGRGNVSVVSHKNIAQVIASDLGCPLSEKQMKQITAWLEEKCRNVEF